MAAVSVIAAVSLALTACTGDGGATASVDENTLEGGLVTSIDEAVESAMAQSGSTSAVVGVWGAGEDGGAYVRGYGDVEAGAQLRAAQAAQPVMCALLLDLVDEGDIQSLDRNVSADLTRQVGIDDITYRQLCTHTSGLADFKGAYRDINVNNPTRPWSARELLSEALVRSPLEWPGLDFHQSDANAVLLARAIEIETGESVATLLEEHVFEAAGMGSSYVSDSLTLPDGALTGLTYPSSGGDPVCDVEAPTEVAEVSATMLSGAGSTVSTVTDLKNFYEQYLGGAFGGEELAALPIDVAPTANPERDENGEPVETEEEEEPDPGARMWGFGVEQTGPLLGRSGAITGTITAAYHDPETGYSVVVALNNSSAGAGFAKTLSFHLAALSAEAGAAPELPWTAEDQAASLAESAICQSTEEEE